MAAGWDDGWWTSADGLRLHYRDYAGDPARPPIICLPGLTRNARDFEGVAERLAGRHRVICAELRGRGESQWAKEPMTYLPPTYLGDLGLLVGSMQLDRFILFGTSLGGILTMLLAAAFPGRVAGALLNDIGPVIETAGMERIRGYVGKQASFPTWLHAARGVAEVHGESYPDYALGDWLMMAKRLCRLNQSGRIVNDYDPRIADPFRQPPPEPVDMWPALGALRGVPALLVRGARSDILSNATADRMQAELPGLERIDIADVGHAPTLDEPVCTEAIERLLGTHLDRHRQRRRP